MKYKLALFDFDGTVADSQPWVLSIVDQMAREFHLQGIAADEQGNPREMDVRQVLQSYSVPFWKMALMVRRVRSLMAKESYKIRLFEGTEECMCRLAENGITLGMVSSNSAENVKAVFGPRLSGLFRYYECGSALFGKPAHIRKILRRTGIPAGQTIMIGDEVRDIEAARAVGVASGAVSWGYARPETLLRFEPDHIFETMEQLGEELT